jgi:hypothetical protein
MRHLYTFHDPAPGLPPSAERSTRIVALKDGVAWWAVPLPFIWLAWHRLWRALAVYVLAAVLVGVLVEFLPLNATAGLLIGGLFNLAVAVQGNDLRRMALARRGFTEVAAIQAASLPEAECLFFDRWARGETLIVPPAPVDIPAGLTPEPAV